jgi:hypothetical protein
MDKLTDEQVAVLAGGDDLITALALEVQQTRARRCGNCVHAFEPLGTDEFAVCAIGIQRPGVNGHQLPLSWSCADFTPKEEEK